MTRRSNTKTSTAAAAFLAAITLTCAEATIDRECQSNFEKWLGTVQRIDWATITPQELQQRFEGHLYPIGPQTEDLRYLSTTTSSRLLKNERFRRSVAPRRWTSPTISLIATTEDVCSPV
jgi:hypothetical protein